MKFPMPNVQFVAKPEVQISDNECQYVKFVLLGIGFRRYRFKVYVVFKIYWLLVFISNIYQCQISVKSGTGPSPIIIILI